TTHFVSHPMKRPSSSKFACVLCCSSTTTSAFCFLFSETRQTGREPPFVELFLFICPFSSDRVMLPRPLLNSSVVPVTSGSCLFPWLLIMAGWPFGGASRAGRARGC